MKIPTIGQVHAAGLPQLLIWQQKLGKDCYAHVKKWAKTELQQQAVRLIGQRIFELSNEVGKVANEQFNKQQAELKVANEAAKEYHRVRKVAFMVSRQRKLERYQRVVKRNARNKFLRGILDSKRKD